MRPRPCLLIGFGLALIGALWSRGSFADSKPTKTPTQLEIVLREAPEIRQVSKSSEVWSWRWPWTDAADPDQKQPTYLVTSEPEFKIEVKPEFTASLNEWKKRRSNWGLPPEVRQAFDQLHFLIEEAAAADSRKPAKSDSPRIR